MVGGDLYHAVNRLVHVVVLRRVDGLAMCLGDEDCEHHLRLDVAVGMRLRIDMCNPRLQLHVVDGDRELQGAIAADGDGTHGRRCESEAVLQNATAKSDGVLDDDGVHCLLSVAACLVRIASET